MRRSIFFAAFFLVQLALALGGKAHAATCRVTPSGGGDGGSWTQAAGLQSALTDTHCTEIWVATGVYTPGAAPDDSFRIRPGAAVYGGFAGDETTRDARDPAVNVTILSGDIDGDDTNTDGNFIAETSADIHGANTHHIVMMDGTTAAGSITATTVLDGFTLTGGDNTNGYTGGGALWCRGSGVGHACSPTLAHLVFSGNNAQFGGAMYNIGVSGGASSPTLTDVTFSGNSAANYQGGAMYNDGGIGGVSSPRLANVTFSGNSAFSGGAMFNSGEDGGISNPMLSNVTFSGNSAIGDGGAMYNYGVGGTSSPTLTNVILWGDTASDGPEIYNDFATVQIDHSVLAANGCAFYGSGTCPFIGFVSTDPLLGSLADNGGSTRTMLPGAGSSVIDAGTCGGAPATDQRGVARPQGAGCDIGAVEVLMVRTGTCLVDAGKPAPGDGATWASAYPDLQSALTDTHCTEIWVAKGIYKPGASPDASFNIHPDVAVYGGFAGTETTRDARDPAANRTILSGDIDNNDINTDGNAIAETSADIQGANTHHIVVMDGITAAGNITGATVLDGFTLTGGDNTNDTTGGGALWCKGSGAGHACNPTLAHLVFSGNRAQSGGAIANDGYTGGTSSPTLTDVTFSGNSARYFGGAIQNYGLGGTSRPTLSNVTFSGNSCAHAGGAIYNIGSTSALSNVTFSGNSATDYGGAMVNNGISGTTLTNVILWGDTAGEGPEIFNVSATMQIDHIILAANGCVANGTGACPSSGFVSTDPLLGPLADNGGSTQTMLPGEGSSAIDAGTCASAPADDQRGIARPQGAGCDIGAVEVREAPLGVSATAGGSLSAGASPLANGDGITDCTSSSGTCSAYYSIPPDVASAPVVSLTATPDAGYRFSSWDGDCASAGSSLSASVTMDQARTCSAAFAADSTVTTLASDINPSSFGQSVTFTATVAPVAPASADPTGTVSFTDGGNALGCDSQPLSATAPFTATCTIATLAAGSHSITAQYGGDTNYPDPQPASNTLVQAVDAIAQAITNFAATPAAPVFAVNGMFTVSATGGASGNPVTFGIDPASASVCSAGGTHGETITTLASGTCTVLADQAGNANYAPATQATLSVAIGVASQTIVFTSTVPTDARVGDDYVVSVTGGGSGNPVIFSIDPASTPDACTIAGSTVAFVGTGTCIIDANQSGNADYAAAAQAQQVVAVGAAIVPATPVSAPTLNGWALLLLGVFLAWIGLARGREA